MGDLTKLKIAAGQIELVEGNRSACERAVEDAVDAALEAGADVLALPCSYESGANVRIIGLNDARFDMAGNVAVLDVCGESYRISVGEERADSDFSIVVDTSPYTLDAPPPAIRHSTLVLRPVGIRDLGKKFVAFDGGSAAYGESGATIVRMRDDFSEGVCTFSLGRAQGGSAASPYKLLTALVASLRRFDAHVLGGGRKWVIGLSGGLDSAVVASLLVLAFGSSRVAAYGMSTRYNTAATKGNAARIARSLGLELREGSIEDLVVSMGNTLYDYGYPVDALKGLVLENVQARTRGNLLSTFAALEGGVVANNGNRIECALGYATLYGDSIGAIAPIADLTKVQLFELSHDINHVFGREVIPENLLPVETLDGYTWQTMPSAELANGQKDPMKWFYHDWLIPRLLGDDASLGNTLDERACGLLARYLEDKFQDCEAGKWVRYYGLDDSKAFLEDFNWVIKSISKAAFKRIQAPPAIALASSASVAVSNEGQIAHEPSDRYRALASKVAQG